MFGLTPLHNGGALGGRDPVYDIKSKRPWLPQRQFMIFYIVCGYA